MNPTEIYLVMEVVDLGGNPVCAYKSKYKAEDRIKHLNDSFTQVKLQELINTGRYTGETAKEWVKSSQERYYIEGVNLV